MPSRAKRVYQAENELKKIMVKVMEAELRTKLLETLTKEGLATKEVAKFVKNQVKTRKVRKEGDYTDMLKSRMIEKIEDSKTDANKLRKDRKEKRRELGKVVNPESSKCRNIMKKLDEKKNKIRETVKIKNREKLKETREYLKDHLLENKFSTPQEYPEKYAELRIFKGEDIPPEPPKPPVIASKNMTLYEEEELILSKGPKFTLRNILDKASYLEETEKCFIKEKYNRIGKEEKDGIVIEEPDEETKWLETQRSMLYNFEEKNINFGKAKPTNWKNIKRVHLPRLDQLSWKDSLRSEEEKPSKHLIQQ
jgi:DNA-binding Lrp family transcriptional regulator